MQYPRICLCAMLVCLFSCFGTVMGQDTIDLKSLADSVRKANGKPNFLPLGMHFLELAKERKDTANISDAYAILASHYYELGDTDSLRLVTYEYMDWADRCHRNTDRYQAWRSSNPRVCTVDSTGHVVARKAGTTTVTAVLNNKTLSCTVRVTNIR